ncbi:hypothetical protein [Nocardia sp. NPDC052566]|uniref:hypothetical protein n=1 Tax=Nocardia sp. NPDC052566 TaxID=3364330 RepID=UPI0037C923A5
MGIPNTNGDCSRFSFWLRVREFAVPAAMIETATGRRRVGDWAGACAAAGFDVDVDVRWLARAYGSELAARVRDDLRYLAPDLLRWHLPRVAPDGLLRPGLTISLARYGRHNASGRAHFVHLVVRTAPAWADSGQRLSLAVWDGPHSEPSLHPHPRPHPRFRLDLHRHVWDARRADDLRMRCGAEHSGDHLPILDPELIAATPMDRGCAIHRWADEARILLDAEDRQGNTFLVRLSARQRLIMDLAEDATLRAGRHPAGGITALPVLPDAATWVLPDLELLRTGAISPDRLHPLVASALVPGYSPDAAAPATSRPGEPLLVECRGERHRIGVVDGVLSALDHDPAEIRREELLVALAGTPLPCLRFIDAAHRHPDCLAGVRERLDHGDTAGALAVVEALLGPEALLRDGDLRDELEASARKRIVYGLFRAGLAETGFDRVAPGRRRPRDSRAHPRNASF